MSWNPQACPVVSWKRGWSCTVSTWVSWGFIQVRRAEVNVFDPGRFLPLSMYFKVASFFVCFCFSSQNSDILLFMPPAWWWEAKLFNFFSLTKVATTAMGDSDPGWGAAATWNITGKSLQQPAKMNKKKLLGSDGSHLSAPKEQKDESVTAFLNWPPANTIPNYLLGLF